jgi:hypothetical protein
MEHTIIYFDEKGPQNTSEVFRIVKKRLKRGDIKTIILASTRGDTARAAMGAFSDEEIRLVVVPHQYGFREENPFPSQLIRDLGAGGHVVHFGTMLFHTTRLYGIETPQVIANFLRTFGHGMKVCFEIAMMATDGGNAGIGEKVLAIAGSNKGADTAVVLTSYPSTQYQKIKVQEILCKPLIG